MRRTLTHTDNGRHLSLGEPKTKKSLPDRTPHAASRGSPQASPAWRAEEKLKNGGLYRDQGLVFAGEGDGLINPSNLCQRSFTPLLKHTGLPHITLHNLRHTCASLLFSENVHPKFVQELLRHAFATITLDTYSHMLPSMGGEALG